MIVSSWIAMRERFSDLLTVDNDGIKTWDTTRITNTFTGADITVTRSALGTTYTFTAPSAADFCFLQPSDFFNVALLSTSSISIALSASGLTECGTDGFSSANRRRLLRNIWLYVMRDSDSLIACGNCSPLYTLATNGSTTL